MTTEEEDPMVVCESADEEEHDEGREVPDEDDPEFEEAGYGHGV